VPCEVVHPTTDFQVFSPGPKNPDLLRRYGFDDGDEIILTVGRLAPGEAYKGHDAVIRVLPAVLQSRPRAKYLVVGEGGDRSRLEGIARQAGLGSRVVFAGHVASSELPDHYRLAEVFAMPSAGEGFGISYLEALGCGCRVVAGSGDGAAEALCGGTLGALVDPGDRAGLGGALTDGLARGRNELLPERVEEIFGRDRFRRELLACLRSIQDA
jgi:glycosyltransferase involved in cell wall biosynthesis